MTQMAQGYTHGAASNTALDSQPHVVGAMSAHVDWLSFSFTVVGSRRLDKLIDTIRDLLQVDIYFDNPRIKDDYSGKFQSFGGSLGLTFSYTHFDNHDICNARLTLPGVLLADRKPWHVKRVCRRFRDDWQAKCTRIDLAVDDYAYQLNDDQLENAIIDKCIVGVRGGQRINSYGTKTAGTTIYLGQRRSAKFARIYDRATVTGGKIHAKRFEIEYKQGLAHSIFVDYLADGSPDSSYLLSSIIRSSISCNYKPDKNLSRSVVFEWWASFVERIVGDTHVYKRVPPIHSLDRTLRWVHRSVSKSLLVIQEALGLDKTKELLDFWMHEARLRCTLHDADEINRIRGENYTLDMLMSEY
jgi:hypothetical protein